MLGSVAVYQNNSLALLRFSRVLVRGGGNDARDRHWWAVDLAHHESSQNGLVELAVGPAGEEAVELDEKREVWVGALLDLPTSC